MGKAFKELGLKRETLVVSTKLFKIGDEINESFMSRKHIIEGTRNSLKRLQLDYVDVIFSHRPDFQTPLEETCRAFSWLIDQGLALYWGTSEWPASFISEAIGLCEKLNLHKPICEQPQYNLFVRERFEKEYKHVFQNHRYGTTIWSPLAGGILCGKYNDGVIPEESRFAL
jgi:aryl-alcohol dehydrogenase-like predicted oxidoreductase